MKDFYVSYLLGRNWQFVPYWYIPRNILLEINHVMGDVWEVLVIPITGCGRSYWESVTAVNGMVVWSEPYPP